MHDDLEHNLFISILSALEDISNYLVMVNPHNSEERMKTYEGIKSWCESGVMANHPMLNWIIGYTLAKNILPKPMRELGVDKMKKMYLDAILKAVCELIDDLENQ